MKPFIRLGGGNALPLSYYHTISVKSFFSGKWLHHSMLGIEFQLSCSNDKHYCSICMLTDSTVIVDSYA